jgi:LCP family protein required for cell wall assembly
MIKKVLLVFIGLNILLVIAAVFYGFKTYKKIVVVPNKPENNQTKVNPAITPTPDPLRPYSILLMGYGGGSHDGGRLTDSIIVAKIDPKLRKVTLISIPRDLWVPIPTSPEDNKYFKINAAYAIGSDDRTYPHKSIEFTGKAGGGEMSKYVIGNIVGFPIDYFIALDFQGFVKTVDKLGGIQVNVQRKFDDYMYPIEENANNSCGKSDEEIKALTATMSGEKLEQQFSCRYEHLHFDTGLQTMDGITALKFARSRHSPQDGGDFNRAARQRLVIQSVKDKVISINFIPKIIPFINTLAGNMQTDIDLVKMQELISKSSELSQYKIESIALTDQNVLKLGTSSNGQSILIPKAGQDQWDQIHEFINNQSISTPSAEKAKI